MYRMYGMPRAQEAQERRLSNLHGVTDVRRDCVNFANCIIAGTACVNFAQCSKCAEVASFKLARCHRVSQPAWAPRSRGTFLPDSQ